MSRLLRNLLIAAVCAMALPPSAIALSQLAIPPTEMAQNADLIVAGRVVGVSARWNDQRTMIFTDVLFTIDEPIASTPASRSAKGTSLTLVFAGGRVGDELVSIADQPEWAIGRRYLLFTRDDGRVYANPLIGGSQGRFELLADESAGKEYVLDDAGRAVLSSGPDGLRVGHEPVASVRDGVVMLKATASFGAADEAGPPRSEEASDTSSPVTSETSAGAPMSLAEFARVIREEWLPARVESPRFQRDVVGGDANYPFGDASPRNIALTGAGNDRLVENLGPEFSKLAFDGTLAPGHATAGATTPTANTATQATTLGFCGDRALPLVMQQVPTSWWSFGENNMAMYTWNLFEDVYRYVQSDGTYGNNSQNEFAGWVSEADLLRVYGFRWDGALAMTVTYHYADCGRIVQSDVMFNPAYAWTTDITTAVRSSAILYMPTVMHELGHTLGYQTGGPYPETYSYGQASVMHAYHPSLWETGLGLHATDARLLRARYVAQTPAKTTSDLGVEMYAASTGLLSAMTDRTTFTQNDPIVISNVTIENMGVGVEGNVRLRFFASPSFQVGLSARQIGSDQVWASFGSGGTSVRNYSLSIPWNLPGGSYYVGAVVTRNGLAGDDFPYNNDAWIPRAITVTNPAPTIQLPGTSDLTSGGATTLAITGSGFVPGVTRLEVGADVSVSLSITSSNAMRASFNVPITAAWGPRNVRVINALPGGGSQLASTPVRVGMFVYPGDADHNGLVDERDVLPIGRYFGQSGPARGAASNAWASQAVPSPWPVRAACYADCNGDGAVNAADVVAIIENWRKTPTSSASVVTDAGAACTAILSALGPDSDDPTSKAIRAEVAAIQAGRPGAGPRRFVLESPSPNPGRGAMQIAFVLPSSQAEVSAEIYSLQGQLVWSNRRAEMAAGRHSWAWDGRNRTGAAAAPGVYLCRVSAGPWVATQRIVRLP